MNVVEDFIRYIFAYSYKDGKKDETVSSPQPISTDVVDVNESLCTEESCEIKELNQELQRIQKENQELMRQLQETSVNSTDALIVAASSGSSESDYVTLLERCAEILKEMDMFADRVKSDEAKSVLGVTSLHIVEALSSTKVSLIDHDTEFDSLLHTPVPGALVDDGTPIKRFIRPGIRIDNKIFVRALVEI